MGLMREDTQTALWGPESTAPAAALPVAAAAVAAAAPERAATASFFCAYCRNVFFPAECVVGFEGLIFSSRKPRLRWCQSTADLPKDQGSGYYEMKLQQQQQQLWEASAALGAAKQQRQQQMREQLHPTHWQRGSLTAATTHELQHFAASRKDRYSLAFRV